MIGSPLGKEAQVDIQVFFSTKITKPYFDMLTFHWNILEDESEMSISNVTTKPVAHVVSPRRVMVSWKMTWKLYTPKV